MKEEPDELERMTRLIQRLKKDSPVRLVAETLLSRKKPHQDQIPQLLNVLNKPRHFHWEEQEVAAWALGHFNSKSAKHYQVAPKLRAVLKWRHWGINDVLGKAVQIYLVTIFIIGLVVAAVFLTLSRSGIVTDSGFYVMIGFMIALLPISAVYAVVDSNRLYSIRAAAARALGRRGAVASINPLIEVILECSNLPWESWRFVNAVREALSILLPFLSEDDYSYLPADTTPNLCWLARQTKEPLSLAALEALGKVGDGRAIPVVEQLAAYGETKGLQEMAEGVLPILYQRQQRAEDRRGLLRAAEAPAATSETLVRPSGKVQDTEPEQLLRASNWEE